ncbi:MAG: FKBP-type peptidyl-prolyl cis-trans isomerase [Oscillospiraceae bacterium]|jgi:trigger factor|nr:FKBP-type peptidyl-prolyl cis-trans isomerase [Oscillospiraceae bacterium]
MKKRLLVKLTLALLLFLLPLLFAACSPQETLSNLRDTLSGWKEDKPYAGYNLSEYITLGDYKGITVEFEPEEFTKAESLARAKSYFAEAQIELKFVETEGKKTVEKGDVIVFDFEGAADGASAQTLEGMKGENQQLEIGSGSFIPGFEEGIIGKERGKEFKLEVTFPAEYDAELAGKPAVFTCTVHKIGSTVIRDEDVNTLTGGQITTVNDLVAYAENELINEVKQANAEKAFEVAFANAKILRLPVREQKYYEDVLRAQAEQQSMGAEEYISANAYTGSLADYKEEYDDERIRRDLFVFAIAEKENLAVTEEDLANLLDNYRSYYSELADASDEEIYAQYGKGFLIRTLMQNKALIFIYNNVGKQEEAPTTTAPNSQ